MFQNIDAAEEWLESWSAGVSEQAARAAQLSSRVASLTGKAESNDGSIRVTVGASGQVEKLELDDRVQQFRGADLAAQILGVMRKAQARLSQQVAEEVQATVGADTETGRAVIHSFDTRFPQPSEDDQDGGARHGR
ncbi:MAG: YbaB/EbfC family nucleoid-associated protein [Hamadaea sp.]|uniref:YbaB/EbfC family nucleoid-associated protein n=1 Tax=Hamadaea sp. TaxID=2024425 RepID=UPI00184538EC|nr:YbaB/EbfC family nucleoid-associated protein [Hamadaea sp.]NUR70179.1 YbaB/EbfC family nucleoid-associated protein [Hamadaea sp.]NUT22703.1 YbaB/EbfC family nucleoid-associated protein [Hamadaea sp.]